MSEFAIETQSLKKHFGQTSAVDGLDVHVPRGAIYGFRFRGLADHLWISATVRAGILLLFPLVAQCILERVDI